MSMMIDAQCSKCARRFGWSGTMAQRPACPRCGFRPPQADLDAAARKMEEYSERLRTHPANAGAEMRRQQRVDAGLTLRQAARLLDVMPSVLSEIEQRVITPTPEFLERMAQIYGVGE
jgi:ribosome-binding protein aMBF1 (putative translation factor)